MKPVNSGYGDVATWGGRHYDDGDAYEAWRGSVSMVDALGEEEAGEILEMLWGGDKDGAAQRLTVAYTRAWEKEEKMMAEGAALARMKLCGRVPAGFDD